jgi:hypothetical protein
MPLLSHADAQQKNLLFLGSASNGGRGVRLLQLKSLPLDDCSAVHQVAGYLDKAAVLSTSETGTNVQIYRLA